MTLASKLVAASKAVGALAADKRNEQGRYDYISADKVLERAGQALADVGVILIPAITDETVDANKTDKGLTRHDAAVGFVMTLSDGDTTLEFPWRGRGSDYTAPDKALYKAVTTGHKYFLMKLLNIGVGNEDGEHENEPAAPQAAAPRKLVPDRKPAPERKAAPQSSGDGGGFSMPNVEASQGRVSELEFYAGLIHDPESGMDEDTWDFVSSMLELEGQSNNPMKTEPSPGKKMSMYAYLASQIDQIAGTDMHGPVLSVLCSKPVHKDNAPGFDVGRDLLNRIVQDKDPHTIDMLGRVAALCRKHNPSQPQLLSSEGEDVAF